MQYYAARWVLPIAGPPLKDGWVAVERDRIVATGKGRPAADLVDLGQVAILPAVVNAHTHLELSWLRGQVPPATAFVGWVRDLLRLRGADGADVGKIRRAIDNAIAEAHAAGTILIGDIANTWATVDPLISSSLHAVIFKELLKFNPDDPVRFVAEARDEIRALPDHARVRVTLAAHAPYSVAPLVFRALKADLDCDPFAPSSVHLGESAEEIEFLQSGEGPWKDLLYELGAWNPSWAPPRCGPVQYLDEAGFLGPRLIVVHGVRFTRDDLDRLAARRVTVVTCPRSNRHTGAGDPPVHDFYASGVRVAIGTDSLASAPDLNVFAEVAALRRLAPCVPASALLESATIEGSRALGFEDDFGTIEPGKRSSLIAVPITDTVEDVEEYLVSGIEPEQIRWVHES